MKTQFLVMSLLALAACGGSGGSSNSQSKAPSKKEPVILTGEQEEPESETGATFSFSYTRKVELAKDFSNFRAFKDAANTYVGTLKAGSGRFESSAVNCVNKDAEMSFEGSFNKSGTKAEIVFSLDGSSEIETSFNCTISSKGYEVAAHTVTLRKSYVVSGVQNAISLGLGGAKKIEALILDEDSVLQTNDSNFSVNMKELYSNKGKIITFPDQKDSEPKAGDPGKSGKMISISSMEAYGDLSFEFRGLKAGAQTEVPARRTEIPAADSSLTGNCRRGRADGYPGYQGYQGHPGFGGHPGGNTGFLILRVFNETDLKLSLNYFPGAGGQGGKGGQGGNGGPGGAGVPCGGGGAGIMGRQGPNGPAGVEGPSGERGLNGKIESSFIVLGNTEQIEIYDNWKNYQK